MKDLANTLSYRDVAQKDVIADIHREAALKTELEKIEDELNYSHKTYYERQKPLLNWLNIFSQFYHILSPVLGIATAYLLAEMFMGLSFNSPILILGIALVIGLALIFIFFALEDFKKILLHRLEKARVNERKNSPADVHALRLIIFLSIVISAVGGSMISYKISDKSQVIVKDFSLEKDSLSKYYLTEITQLRNSIATIEAIRKSPARKQWGGALTPQEDKHLNDYKNRLINLEKERDVKITGLKNDTQASLSDNSSFAWASAGVSGLIVIIFELLLVFCYRYTYTVKAKARYEARLMGNTSPELNVNINPNLDAKRDEKIHSSPTLSSQKSDEFLYANLSANFASKTDMQMLVNQINTKLEELKNFTSKKDANLDVNVNTSLDAYSQVNNPIGFNGGFKSRDLNVNSHSDLSAEAAKIIEQISFKDLGSNLSKEQKKLIKEIKQYFLRRNSPNKSERITLQDVANNCDCSLSTVNNWKARVEDLITIKTSLIEA